jgi:hypothetical protein
MSIEDRKRLINTIEGELRARLVTFVTGDRLGLETRIAGDSLPLISSLLSRLEGTQERIALFLYTPGGDTITGWGMVNLLRQYCDKFAVVVPFRALSTGTLIALGADELYLGRHGFLSPIDPSVASPFNPSPEGAAPQGPRQLLPVSVEDLAGFLDLARNELKISDQDSLVKIMEILSNRVHPLALGAVYRAREQSGTLARRLLEHHMDDRVKIDQIVDKLTRQLPTHSYLIGRDEARDYVGLTIKKTTEGLETAIWQLYQQYADWFRLTEPYSPILDIGSEQSRRVTYERAAIEMIHGENLYHYVFLADKELTRIQIAQHGIQTDQVGERLVYQGWRPMRDGEVIQ